MRVDERGCMVRVVFFFVFFFMLSSMDRASRPSTVSNTPVTLTIRRREAELASLAEREAEACRRVETLESDMDNMRDRLEQNISQYIYILLILFLITPVQG